MRPHEWKEHLVDEVDRRRRSFDVQ
jgi:hypothetical protein